MMVVGVDISTFRVNTAWMDRGQACRWHVDLGGPKVPVIDRIRAAKMCWPLDVTEVCIEQPYGPNRDTSGKLMAVVGAVTRSVPRYARCAWMPSGDLRRAIGSHHDDKPSAHHALGRRIPKALTEGWDEHELDALVACLGWTQILNDQE